MPLPSTFVSYSQNREDVVLWRALRNIEAGRYVDIGANDPRVDSISRGFYDLGWRGVTVEPVPSFAAAHREERPGDLLVEAAVTDEDITEITLHVFSETGLSTLVDSVSDRHEAAGLAAQDVIVPALTLDSILEGADLDGQDIHFMTIDVEGAEPEVLRSVDLSRWKPWVLVVEATAPRSTEPTFALWEKIVLDAGYTLCLFDGLSRFYVSAEHVDLAPLLAYPACPLDTYETDHDLRQRATIDTLTADVVRWRTAALTRWAEEADLSKGRAEDKRRIVALEDEIVAIHRTLSWRVTAPIRAVRRVGRV